MSNRFIPNSFQVPNAVVDELIAEMSEAELKCFLLVIRKTTGWNKEMDAISISQFMELLKLSKGAVISGCERLIEKGLLTKTTGYRGTNVFSLNWSKIQTSPKFELVQNLDITSQNFRQDLVKNLDTQTDTIQTDTIQTDTIQNNTPLNPPKGEADRKRSHSAENLQAAEKKSRAVKFSPETVTLPEWVDREVWVAYCEMRRKAKRAPIKTEATLKLCLEELELLSGRDKATASAVLNQSIKNTWTGLFALKTNAMPGKSTTVKRPSQTNFAEKDYGETKLPGWAKD